MQRVNQRTGLLASVALLCRGEPEELCARMAEPKRWLAFCLLVIVVGSGSYGATIGLWRAPLQGLYAAIKFPALILLTTALNAAINGMLAQVLGLGISFRQSFLAVTTSFAIASAVLGSLSPVALFVLYNTPPLGAGDAVWSHNFAQLAHVSAIALAGVVGNTRLFRYLARLGSRRTAAKILCAWLVVNMFLGCQLSWIMRPFVGAPQLPVQFFRPNALEGNFYETAFEALMNVVDGREKEGETPNERQ